MKKLIEFFRTRIFKPNYCDWCGKTRHRVLTVTSNLGRPSKKLCMKCIDEINN